MSKELRDEYIVVAQTEESTLPPNWLENTAGKICQCTICFIIGNSPAGSGTLVSIGGRYGILTAQHVANEVMASPEGALSICLRTDPHRPEVWQRQLRPNQIGRMLRHENNPDLSFIEITDHGLLASVTETRTFYSLDEGASDIISSIQVFRKGGIWCTAGAPKEFCERVPDLNGGQLFKVGFLCGKAEYCHNGHDASNDFDELTLRVPIGGNHPKDYDGMSGGGVWLIYLNAHTESADSSFDLKSILVGVIREQSNKAESGTRKIYAYGPRSIYKKVPEHLS